MKFYILGVRKYDIFVTILESRIPSILYFILTREVNQTILPVSPLQVYITFARIFGTPTYALLRITRNKIMSSSDYPGNPVLQNNAAKVAYPVQLRFSDPTYHQPNRRFRHPHEGSQETDLHQGAAYGERRVVHQGSQNEG